MEADTAEDNKGIPCKICKDGQLRRQRRGNEITGIEKIALLVVYPFRVGLFAELLNRLLWRRSDYVKGHHIIAG